MNLEVVSKDKNEAQINIDNSTVAEILRVFLYENGADFAAWKREHPSKPAILKIKTSSKTVAKAVTDSVAAIKKECDSIVSAVKK